MCECVGRMANVSIIFFRKWIHPFMVRVQAFSFPSFVQSKLITIIIIILISFFSLSPTDFRAGVQRQKKSCALSVHRCSTQTHTHRHHPEQFIFVPRYRSSGGRKKLEIVILRASIQSNYWVKRTKYIMASSTLLSAECHNTTQMQNERSNEKAQRNKGKNSNCNRNLNAYIVEALGWWSVCGRVCVHSIFTKPPSAVCLFVC